MEWLYVLMPIAGVKIFWPGLIILGVGVGIIPRSSAVRHARTMKLALVPLSDAWALRETKIVNRAGEPLPRLAAELVRHLANFSFADRLL